MSRRTSSSRIYVGNLPDDISEREIEDIFYKFGRIRDIDIKCGRNSNGTAYAFVEFDDPRDAEDAVYDRDGYKFCGDRLRVEFTGERRPRKTIGNSGGPPKRTDYRVVVTGLPQSASWQDLKDHMRKAGPVGYANIEHGIGVVEYENGDDMEWALRKLDRSEFKNIFHCCCIRVRRDGWRSTSRSHSGYTKRRRGRSRSISASRRRSCSGSSSYRNRGRHERKPSHVRYPRCEKGRSPDSQEARSRSSTPGRRRGAPSDRDYSIDARSTRSFQAENIDDQPNKNHSNSSRSTSHHSRRSIASGDRLPHLRRERNSSQHSRSDRSQSLNGRSACPDIRQSSVKSPNYVSDCDESLNAKSEQEKSQNSESDHDRTPPFSGDNNRSLINSSSDCDHNTVN